MLKKVTKYSIILILLAVVAVIYYSDRNQVLRQSISEKVSNFTHPSESFPIEEAEPIRKDLHTSEELIGIDITFDCTNPNSNPIIGEIYALINHDRKQAGLDEYKWDSKLCESADMKNRDMLANDYFEHISPTFVTPWYWIDRAGYRYSLAGENLVMNILTAPEIHQALMNSEGHRANIMSETFGEVGLALAIGEMNDQQAFVLTQHFATPLGKNEYISQENVICNSKDVKKAKENLGEIEKNKDKIDSYLEDAEEQKDKLEKNDMDTEEVENYIDNLEKERKKLKEYEKEIEDYLEKCEK